MQAGQILDFITPQEQEVFLNYYENNTDNRVVKKTGPKILELCSGDNHTFDTVVDRLRENFGDFDLRHAHIFDVTERPHILHNDNDSNYGDRCHYGFTIPLKLEGEFTELPKLVVYDQLYPSGGVKLVKGTDVSHIPQTHNQLVTEYSNVVGLVDDPFPQSYHEKHLTHLLPQWLEGMSVNCDFDWHLRSVISFNSKQIHSASDYTRLGVTRKLGLAIFTLSKD